MYFRDILVSIIHSYLIGKELILVVLEKFY